MSQPGAAAAQRHEGLTAPRMGDHRGQRPVRIAHGDAHRPVRDAPQVVGRPVKGVDDPPQPGAPTAIAALFGDVPVLGPFSVQNLHDRRLGGPVGVRDHVRVGALGVDAGRRAFGPHHQLTGRGVGRPQRGLDQLLRTYH